MKNLIIILLFYCYPVSGQLINKLEKLYQEKQFVELEIQNRRDNNILYFYYKAIFANVCNKPKLSNEFLDSMEVKALPKSILYKYWVLRNDNYVKCFDYKNAYLSNKLINSQFKKNLNKEEFEGSLQSEQIWYSLQTVPPQQILKEKKVSILLKYDIAGLMNLSVSTKSGESDFVFDTGAGLSTISEVEAKRLGFRILESSKILVKGFTGIDNEIKIGIIDTLTIGRIKILNPVFLVFKDSALSFANGAYKINGIIGFPIAKDLGTITIENNQLTIENTRDDYPKNLFVEMLHPILLLKYNGETNPYNFDTGAKETILSKSFYDKYRKTKLFQNIKPSIIETASAGGSIKYKQLDIPDISFGLSSDTINFYGISCDISNYHIVGREIFGNIGQDLLKQYSKIVLSFENNYLKLEK